MRGIVRKRFISFPGAHEAVVEYMYLDSKSVVTVGIGFLEAVQQFKTKQKRKVDNARNQKRRNIFGAKTNCETASLIDSQGSAIPLGGWTRKTDGTPATEQEIATNGTWRKTQELPESESPYRGCPTIQNCPKKKGV